MHFSAYSFFSLSNVIITKKVERIKGYQWKRSNNHTQSKIGVSNKHPIPTRMSCRVDMGTLSEIEGSGCHRLYGSILLEIMFQHMILYMVENWKEKRERERERERASEMSLSPNWMPKCKGDVPNEMPKLVWGQWISKLRPD